MNPKAEDLTHNQQSVKSGDKTKVKSKSCDKQSDYHIPVMLDEVISGLNIKSGNLYFDGTLGGGGHSIKILNAGGRLLGIDRDSDAIEQCQKRFKQFDGKFKLIKANFKSVKSVLCADDVADFVLNSKDNGNNLNCLNDNLDISQFTKQGVFDGALVDLGISSHQIDTPSRGMSYRFDSKLDMRMDLTQHLNAETIVNEYSEEELVRILFEYGEERFAKRIAGAIVRQRAISHIDTTGKLVKIVLDSVPKSYKKNPAIRTFQALRIEVNNELRGLDNALLDIFNLLKANAKLCVISFHSLEDRIVKQVFNRLSAGCICDKSLPVCVCGHMPEAKLFKKQKPSQSELAKNSRCASATLRIIQKL